MAAENMLRFVVAAVCLSAAASIRIDTTDGGYEEVKVSISKEVPYNETIVDDIKALFESSSKFLHRATNGRVYFKRVTIEFPISWPKRVGARPLSSSSFEESDVRIELPVGPYGDEPFTEKRMPCGGQGAFIGLTPGFLAQTRNVTTQGSSYTAYKFVHEWAHYRYGVFDEHGIPGDSRYPLLYCHGRMVQLNACSRNITFKLIAETPGTVCRISKRCTVPDNCVIVIPMQIADVESSIMFMPYIKNVNQFCKGRNGNRQHNPFAPNEQNAICNQRSTWEVISEHADFQKLTKPDLSKHINVTFEEAQQKDDLTQRVVLVQDVSNSTNINDWLKFLKEAAKRYVQNIEDNSRRLGIVACSTNAKVVHPLMLVNNITRGRYLDEIEKLEWDGSTCIGCGLKSALEQLTSSNETAEGGLILLVSAGKKTDDPSVTAILPMVVEAKAVVSTVTLGLTVDNKLEELALLTGGKAFGFQDLQGNAGLDLERAFMEATTAQSGGIDQSQTLLKSEEEFRNTFEKAFYIDSEAGNNTEVHVRKYHPGAIEAWLVDPNGQLCKECVATVVANHTRILTPTATEAGHWTLHLSSNTSDRIGVGLKVRSKARTENYGRIHLTCKRPNEYLRKFEDVWILAKLYKGTDVIVDAVVYAEVTSKKLQGKFIFRLYDNGKAPDFKRNDGEYAGYFTKFNGQGVYHVKIDATTQNTTRLAYPSWRRSGIPFTEAMFAPTTSLAKSLDAPSGATQEGGLIYMKVLEATYSGKDEQRMEDFMRTADCGAFDVTEDWFESQVPPYRINNLKLSEVGKSINGTLLVEATWTSTGAHMMSGIASSAEIRASWDFDKLKANFESGTPIPQANIVKGDLNPRPPYTEHRVTFITLPQFSAPGTDVYDTFFAVRVSNSGGFKSVSNIAFIQGVPSDGILNIVTPEDITTSEASTTATTKDPTTQLNIVTTKDITTSKASRTAITKAPTTKSTKVSEATTKTSAWKQNQKQKSWVAIMIAGVIMLFIVISVTFVIRQYCTTPVLDQSA